MKRILFFINAKSGTDTPTDLETAIAELSETHSFRYRIALLDDTDIQAQLRKELSDYKPSVAVAAGGDGTVNLVAGAIRGSETKLGIIPLGSSNGLAYELGIPGDQAGALRVVAGGKVEKLDALLINGSHLCLHLSDLGMNARVVHRYEDENIRGFFGYARQYFRELKNRHKFRYEIGAGEEVARSKAVMIVMANASRYGTGARVTPDGDPSDGVFEVVMVKAFPFWFLLYMTVSIILRNFNPNKFRKIIRCREAEISVHPSQELQVDGEPFGKVDKVRVELLPGTLNVICPVKNSILRRVIGEVSP